jgi:peroxiredoxin
MNPSADQHPAAPPWQTTQWFNRNAALSLEECRGKVIALHAFQMLCPGCVQHGLPQAQKIHAMFDNNDVVVVGLHTVFEHHAAMTPVSLAAFIHEYRLTFPIGVDAAGPDGGVPLTMAAYQMRGTPTLVLIDRQGRVRWHRLGQVEDMAVGAAIASLIRESA